MKHHLHPAKSRISAQSSPRAQIEHRRRISDRRRKRRNGGHLLVLWGLILGGHGALAEVMSETLYFLEPDGKHYLLLRSTRSDSPGHRFHLPAGVERNAIRYVSPPAYRWESHEEGGATLAFDSGSFTLIYAGHFTASELQQQPDGSWLFRSWQGEPDEAGRFGYWYAPGKFDRYDFGWLIPENIEVTSYHSNVRGQWTEGPGALAFHAKDVNNVTFEIAFRVHPPNTSAPPTPAGRKAAVTQASPAALTDDGDAVPPGRDLCPRTPKGAKVDQVGCALDADRDGIPDGIDRCPATEEETPVDAYGCPTSKTPSRD